MTGLVDSVRGKLDERCLVSRLKKNGCKVKLKGAPAPRAIIDLDKPGSPLGQSRTRCDYLFVAEVEDEWWVAPLELKKGQLHANEAIRQLQAGAIIADQLVPPEEPVKLHPVAVSGGMHKAERNTLRSKGRVRFRGRTELIRLMSCGDSLVKVLRS